MVNDMWNLTALNKENFIKIEPLDDELVRDYCMRVIAETQRMTIPDSYLRDSGRFYEVLIRQTYDETIEDWLFEFAREGAYYCTDLFSSQFSTWFFNDKETAAMFKLMYGEK